MNKNTTYQGFNSAFSLKPFIVVLKRLIAEGGPGARKLYQPLLSEIEAVPALLQPLADETLLTEYKELIEGLLAAVFPPSAAGSQQMHAVYLPFSSEAVYATGLYREVILNLKSAITYKQTTDFRQALLSLAYNLILKQFYSHDVPVVAQSVQSHTDGESGLKQFFELKLDAQFVEVQLINKEYILPARFNPQRPLTGEELTALFPLGNFRFEGLMVARVEDITREQVITEMKNMLLDSAVLMNADCNCDLHQHIQSLIGLKEAKVGITPFFKMNSYYLHADKLYENSLLFSTEKALEHKDEITQLCEEAFKGAAQPLIYPALNEESGRQNPLLSYYIDGGAKGLILCPLKSDGSLIGLLEISVAETNLLTFNHFMHLRPAIPLFCTGIEKAGESLEMQVDKIIKEHFTAIQPAVEWKFTEAAFNYLQHKQLNDLAKMPAISFDNIYPLYAAIDIRNSSVERNNAIQLDLIEQLTAVQDVIDAAARVINFPLLKEIKYKIDGFIAAVSGDLLSDDELQIYDFLQTDIDALFRDLRLSNPEMKAAVDDYFAKLDPQRRILYHHRKDYEDSITRINDVLDRFVDNEQQDAQDVYPHYFERYITDGVELNMYIGQSLSPNRRFSELYVRNLKLWQLHLLAKAARLTHALEKRLNLPLQTTQLILAHSLPLSISFRRKERKFDVDGAYNIRYEIIKKRIDKVHLKNSKERLTQPGRIAIVYSQQKELTEYLEFISFLQAQKILGNDIEHLDLEDTQGISGLKAVRVDVVLSGEATVAPQQELSNMTTGELLKK